ncbi:MAG TPA: XRE family transcriptional regulator, partial [Candidatus Limnocylindria bacterium]|nr:XRE family transcriptional regulator [Candidatus Limnocylindria bacterium]
MDDQRVGRIVRASRRRRRWRQVDLAAVAGCSQNLVSLIERGHSDRVAMRTMRRVLASLDATASIE